jgi:hypothetical protein
LKNGKGEEEEKGKRGNVSKTKYLRRQMHFLI